MQRIRVGDKEYELTDLSKNSKNLALEVQRVSLRIQENQNLMAVLKRAKRGYVADLKTEMLSAKAGIEIMID